MSRPWKHPDSGIFYLRRAVPDALKPIVGKSMEKVSLGTRDPAEARIRHAERLADLELRWAALRQGNAKLSHKQIIAIAGEFYRSLIDEHADEPGDPSTWQYRLFYDRAYFNPEQVKITKLGNWSIDPRMVIARRYDRPIRAFLIDRGLQVDEATFEKVRHEVRRALRQAHETLDRHAQGDYRPDPDAGRFPPAEIIKEALTPRDKQQAKARVSIIEVFAAYAKEANVSSGTKKRWRPIMTALEAEVGDLQKITPEWCVAWKDRLLAQELANKTVQEVYLASLRAICNWAVTNRRIATNPLVGISVKVKDKRRNRTAKGYTDAEANIVLSATLQPAPARMSPKNKAARRWVPWLCAYTGARVGEIAQMRKEDVFEKDGVWIMHVTPEAGTTKTGFPRDVPIHSHLIDQGFLDFVRQADAGPLFYEPNRRRRGSDENPQWLKVGQRLGEWIRSIGITDPELQPNHGWRHRFATVGRRVHMDSANRAYIEGHVPPTVGEEYGEYETVALKHEIEKIPRFPIG